MNLSSPYFPGIPPTAAFGAAPPVVSYGQIAAAPPPSYVESLSHPVVPSPPGAPPQYPPQYSSASAAAAAASAQQLQMVSIYALKQFNSWKYCLLTFSRELQAVKR